MYWATDDQYESKDRQAGLTHYKANAHLIEAVWEQIYGFKADEQAKAASKTNLIFAGV